MPHGPQPYQAVGSGHSELHKPTTPSVPASGSFVQNTVGIDIMVYVSGGTISHLYINSTNSTSGALDLGSIGPTTVLVPANYWIRLDYTGSPVWAWQGLV